MVDFVKLPFAWSAMRDGEPVRTVVRLHTGDTSGKVAEVEFQKPQGDTLKATFKIALL